MLCLANNSLTISAAGHWTLLRCSTQVLETIHEASSDELHVEGFTEPSSRQL
jgi:hypothetical protein